MHCLTGREFEVFVRPDGETARFLVSVPLDYRVRILLTVLHCKKTDLLLHFVDPDDSPRDGSLVEVAVHQLQAGRFNFRKVARERSHAAV